MEARQSLPPGREGLHRLCVRLLGLRRQSAVLDELVEGAIEVLRAERGYLVHRVSGGEPLFLRRWGARPEGTGEPVSRAIVADALSRPGPVLVRDASTDERYAMRDSVRRHALRSVLAARIGAEENVALYIESGSRELGDEELELFRRILEVSDAGLDLSAETAHLESSRDLSERFDRGGIVARDESMLQLLREAGRMADAPHPVLIGGETGTGKELVARFLHRNSSRRDQPLVMVNSAAMAPELVDAELFGHVRGAFTGATSSRPGLIRAADGGTLVFDEIGELPPAQQAKLLRVIENGELQPVGDGQVRKVDVRFVASTHLDLEAEVAAGRFREDLFYRLNVLSLHVPPLAERPDDVLPLFEHFLEAAAERAGVQVLALAPGVRQALVQHAWPGNVRELRNLAQKLSVLARDGVVEVADLPTEVRRSRHPLGSLAEAERAEIVRHLQAADHNLSAAARSLKISREGLRQKMRRLGVPRRPE